jgi:transcription elongation factor GreA
MPNYVTKEGLARLKQELQDLKKRRRELSEKLQRAISAGDLSENADYQEAKEEQAFLEGRISELEQAIATSVLIEERHGGATVRIGSTVIAERVGGAKREHVFMIVGSEEADPASGKISYLSPLGAALIGHRVGDEVEFLTPQGPARWRIRAVR